MLLLKVHSRSYLHSNDEMVGRAFLSAVAASFSLRGQQDRLAKAERPLA